MTIKSFLVAVSVIAVIGMLVLLISTHLILWSRVEALESIKPPTPIFERTVRLPSQWEGATIIYAQEVNLPGLSGEDANGRQRDDK